MGTTFASASPIPAFGAAPADPLRFGPSRYQWVDALVAIAVMAWFAAALVGMVGELPEAPSVPATQPVAVREMPIALPQASSWPGKFAHARMTLI